MMVDGLKERFASIRKEYGLNVKDFAASLDMEPTTLSSIETGKREPSKEVLYNLAVKYSISLNWIFTGEGEKSLAKSIIYHKGDEILNETDYLSSGDVSFFKFSHGKPVPIPSHDADPNALVMIPVYSQRAAAGSGEPPTQLEIIETYIPILNEMLGGAAPRNCGIVRVVGDSMTDMTLFNGDLVIFDRSQIEGDGVYVISMGGDVRIKRLEYRIFEKKIIIRSENLKRYPDPEIITHEQAQEMLLIHGKVISWVHRHPY